MDYEKKYKEAIKIAKSKIKNDKDHVLYEEDIIEMFPELKESEDERGYNVVGDNTTSGIRNCGIATNNCQNFPCVIRDGEQKSTDKVEPKFKVGDWLATGLKIRKIIAVGTGLYVMEREDGTEVSLSVNYVEKNYHLWAIQDAKDGDVLFHSDTASNGIFVFKEILQCGTIQKVVCYCDYDSEDGFCLGEKHTCCWTHSKILHPATKEQRDRLFQKMKEAGYEWDANKKELK